MSNGMYQPQTETAAVYSGPALLRTYGTFPFVLESAQGETLTTTDGRKYLDFYGGHCVCGTGHGHPTIRRALHAQLDKLLFYSSAAEIEIRNAAATTLVEYAQMSGVFFCNSGSEANENALKLAVKQTGRSRFLAFSGSFHGRTLLALSVTDDVNLQGPYRELLAEVDFLPFNDLAALEEADLRLTAAAIVEPVQSMAGVRVADRTWLQLLRRKCTEAGALLIFDEVQTGFGRLGTSFAASYFEVMPDMLTVAKGIASGFPLGALLVNPVVADSIKPGDLGSTFGGGPLACAALLATLEILRDEDLPARARLAEERIRTGLAGEAWLSICGVGLLLGINAGVHASPLKSFLLEHGVIVGGSNDPRVLRLMPPLTIGSVAVDELTEIVQQFGRQIGGPGTGVSEEIQ